MHAVEQRASGRSAPRRTGTNTVASQSSSVGSRRSARRNSRSAARSSWSTERDPQRAFVSRARDRRRAGAQHDVLRREDPLHQLARGLERRRARVEAAEEQLDEAPRDLGGEHALGGRVERADVERARVAQRDRRRAGRERLVDVHELRRRRPSAPPRSCARCRAGAPASRRGGRRPAAAARRRRARARRRRGRSSSPPRISRRGLAHERGIARRREHRDAVARGGLLGGEGADEGVDLVLVLPGIRRHLGDGEGLRQGGKRSPGWTDGREIQVFLTLAEPILRKP